ncbi:hypothetical protein O4090_15935 [Dietzia kunjamensis]|jgi:hypothetical protein|uniref:hypothetical protein n=1 Tax=Dietzia TaxID=37914 RepID=UPI000E91F5F8|nr:MULTISPECIES: hypothetical protein [Dietzia]HBD21201.1 hypothetical protein [Dietzia sp.]MCZ4541679.1 hypothetical protein [Dietzia maris]MCZ4657442.1 hypothetical protein [Dietzia kunjamensis]MDJ0423895.1 hypothetical protein [Dietzia kunjamensis]MDV3356916.1 hypothetical protein [Dietzia sp. IN118]
MSKRSDRADERRAVKQAQKDLDKAGTTARKAFDLKDPRFLGEAAVAATRGPVGLALFGASRGIQVIRDRRAEQAELLGDLAADARQHASALREQTSALATPPQKRNPLRRFAPLWIVGLAGGAAVAGATAYFLRGQGSPTSPSAPTPTPAPPRTPTPAEAAAEGRDQATGSAPAATTGPGVTGDPVGSETGEDLTIESADPEGPSDQSADTSPAAGSAVPGPAAGSAPQPSDDQPVGEASTDGTATDK